MGLGSEDAYTTQLQAIVRIAHDMRQVAAVSLPSTQTTIPSHGPTLTDSVRLPAPSSLLPALVETGVSSQVTFAADQIYQRRAEQLRQHIQESIMNARRAVAELPAHASALPPDIFIKRVTSIFIDLYLSRLKEWKDEIIQRIKQTSESSAKETLRDSRVFNQEYIPLLEHFFEGNPFPTRADKTFLAKKSGMQYRQIHVWFQNRRNRSKKEGKILRKKPTHQGAARPLDKSYELTKGHVVESVCLKTCEVVSPKGTTEVANPQDTFASTPPLHAFPSCYPPICHYDPFPCKNGPVRFSIPEWRRVARIRSLRSVSIGIDELVESFSQLNVRDETRSLVESHAATAAITVIPSPAPHPSLNVHTYHQPTNDLQRHPLVRAPTSSLNVFRSPSPSSKPATLVPLVIPPSTSELPGKRRTAPLPRRSPGRLRSTSRDPTPSDSSSISSTSPRLSHSVEASSCSSSVSSLSTPDIASPQDLPLMFGSPCSLFDNPRYLYDLGDMAAVMPSPVS